MKKDMKLEGWKAKVVLAASIVLLLNTVVSLPFLIVLSILASH